MQFKQSFKDCKPIYFKFQLANRFKYMNLYKIFYMKILNTCICREICKKMGNVACFSDILQSSLSVALRKAKYTLYTISLQNLLLAGLSCFCKNFYKLLKLYSFIMIISFQDSPNILCIHVLILKTKTQFKFIFKFQFLVRIIIVHVENGT